MVGREPSTAVLGVCKKASGKCCTSNTIGLVQHVRRQRLSLGTQVPHLIVTSTLPERKVWTAMISGQNWHHSWRVEWNDERANSKSPVSRMSGGSHVPEADRTQLRNKIRNCAPVAEREHSLSKQLQPHHWKPCSFKAPAPGALLRSSR